MVLLNFFCLNVQLLRNKLVASARQSVQSNSSLGKLYGNMQEAYQQMQTPLIYQQTSQGVCSLFFTTHETYCYSHLCSIFDIFDVHMLIQFLIECKFIFGE